MKSVLILLDQYGWAFDFNARGIIKYSTKFKIAAKRWDKLTQEDAKYDLFFPMNYEVWSICGDSRLWLNGKKYCVGVRSGSLDSRLKKIINGKPRIAKFHGVGCNSFNMYKKLKKAYPSLRNIRYTPNGVDTKIFKPYHHGKRFRVGWAGATERKCKRVHLAKKLKYPVKIMSNRFGKYFQKGISRQPMIRFYHSIDCLVNFSSYEGMNNVILEACAMGLPVISTAVGDIPRLIQKKWLVPKKPDRLITEMNKKLTMLKKSPALRKKVGNRNRKEVLKNWNWKKQVKNYEKMFAKAIWR